jgi:hypothetical protein
MEATLDTVNDQLKIERNIGPAGGWSRQLGAVSHGNERVIISRQTVDLGPADDRDALIVRLSVVSRLRHPGLTPVVEAGIDDEGAYTIEAIGKSLPLDVGKCVLPEGDRLGRGLVRVMEALAYVHRHRLAHGAVSRRVVVSDGKTLRLSGVGLKHATGAAAVGEDVVSWAELVRDLFSDRKRTALCSLVLAAATDVIRLSREGRTPSASDVARRLRRELAGLSGEATTDADFAGDRGACMKALDGVAHFSTSMLLGLMTTAMTAAILAGIVALGVIKFLDTLPQEVVVPNVVGLQLAEAETRLKGQGLEISDIRRVYREDEAPGEVVGTLPEVGMTVREGREIALIVSRGAAQVRVPRLIGFSPDEARSALEKIGLVGREAGKVLSEAPEGEVVRQDPGPGQQIAQGEIVDFFLSGGAQFGTVVLDVEDGESQSMLFRRIQIVVPVGDALQRVEVKEGYDDLETTYDRLHRPGDEIKLDTYGRPGRQIKVLIEGAQVFETKL